MSVVRGSSKVVRGRKVAKGSSKVVKVGRKVAKGSRKVAKVNRRVTAGARKGRVMRTVQARHLKEVLEKLEKGIRTIRLAVNHLDDGVEITYQAKKAFRNIPLAYDPQGSGGGILRPQNPWCFTVPTRITAGHACDWIQVLQSRLDDCRIAMRALGRNTVLNSRRR